MTEKCLGFSTAVRVVCSRCEYILFDGNLCKRVGDSLSPRSPFEVNMLASVAFRGIGCGYSAMRDWCGTMNINHCLSRNGYQKMQGRIQDASKKTLEEITDRSDEVIFEKYGEGGVKPDENIVLDIAVSFEGSWQKRRHSSHNGMASIIDLLTGLPVDFGWNLDGSARWLKMLRQQMKGGIIIL